MTKINVLHLADIHIGVETYGRFDSGSGLNSRVLDFLRRMTEAIDHALANGVDVCIFAGDAYKNQRPNPTIQREFARRISMLTNAGVPVVLLVGNHDMSTVDKAASSLDIFDVLGDENIIVGNREKLHQIKCRRGQDLQVATVPYPQRHRLLLASEYRKLTIDELDSALSSIVSQSIGFLADKARAKPDVPAVLCGHFSVGNAVQGSEQSVMIGRDAIIPRDALIDPIWDYVALGHIHKHQNLNLSNKPPIIYPGSLERLDFGEEKDPKGFVMVELEKGIVDWSFIKLKSRKFKTIRIDVRGLGDPMATILDTIDEFDIKDAVVRVVLNITEMQMGMIEDRAIKEVLAGANYIASIKHDVEREIRHRLDISGVEEMSPHDVMDMFFRAKGLSDDDRGKMMELTDEMMAL